MLRRRLCEGQGDKPRNAVATMAGAEAILIGLRRTEYGVMDRGCEETDYGTSVHGENICAIT